MAGLPEITVAGTLTADPELRYLPTGTPLATFTVAANDRRYDQHTGRWADHGATFLRCSVWREVAEHVAESLTRGTRVLLTGTLRQREWETTDGDKRSGFEVDVTEIGASLKWATTQVSKTTRTHPTPAPADTTNPGDTPTGNLFPASDQPPF
ncbi:MAG TPA: single-stranded DNA-binding protein [Pseudonocardiaceae bacterium]|jgi:single-strand DNA-binding protein|nr:single-stranded DNA-binding protein [Pseudonocardiaceae bacterium]